jgi:hypothetical protein
MLRSFSACFVSFTSRVLPSNEVSMSLSAAAGTEIRRTRLTTRATRLGRLVCLPGQRPVSVDVVLREDFLQGVRRQQACLVKERLHLRVALFDALGEGQEFPRQHRPSWLPAYFNLVHKCDVWMRHAMTYLPLDALGAKGLLCPPPVEDSAFRTGHDAVERVEGCTRQETRAQKKVTELGRKRVS